MPGIAMNPLVRALLAFALVKISSTGWRFGRYYRREPHYQLAGPPPALLRLLGPAVVVRAADSWHAWP